MAKRFSVEASLKGVKEIYVIIVSLGMTSALTNLSANHNTDSHFIYHLIIFLGFFFLVFQFSLGTFNILDHIEEQRRARSNWTRILFLLSICFLLSSFCFYLMGGTLSNKPNEPIIYGNYVYWFLWLLFFDTVALIIAHQPWAKYIFFRKNLYGFTGFICWSLFKSVYILFFGIFRGYSFRLYRFISQKLFTLKTVRRRKFERLTDIELRAKDRYIRKVTHYWWLSTNLYSALFLFWMQSDDFALTSNQLTKALNHYLPFSILNGGLFYLSLLLIILGLLNFIVNHEYFFGE